MLHPRNICFYKTNYAQICVEMYFNKGFPDEINLITPNDVWAQKIDYVNTSFICILCYETGHVIKKFPNRFQNSKVKKNNWRPIWWEEA